MRTERIFTKLKKEKLTLSWSNSLKAIAILAKKIESNCCRSTKRLKTIFFSVDK
jgi:hypothetical protein